MWYYRNMRNKTVRLLNRLRYGTDLDDSDGFARTMDRVLFFVDSQTSRDSLTSIHVLPNRGIIF